MLIDQQLAHERILYEYFLELIVQQESYPQQRQLFPQLIELSAMDAVLMKEMIPDIKMMGFDLDEFGPGSFVVNGIPADLPNGNINQIVECLIEDYKLTKGVNEDAKKNILAKSFAKNMAIKHGKVLQAEEMNSIIDRLFACKQPTISIEGKNTLIILQVDELEKKFK